MSRTESRENVLAAILSQENFWPTEPRSLAETGLPISFIESLILKRLSVVGLSSGRQLARFICLPFDLIQDTLGILRERQRVVHKGSAPLNDYTYALTEQGRERARLDMASCSYVGPAPVPLTDYVVSAEAQTIRSESPKRRQLEAAFKDVSVNKDIFETLGPAVNSGAGLFLYGEPGNGKTTLAKRVIRCFGQQVWIPYAIVDDGQIIKFFDPSLHVVAEENESALDSTSYDERWVRIQRPTVIVGGELTLDSLEIRHDPISNVSEAPLQLKANCGCFLIDDFGRQRVDPTDLLNRWIVPLENRIDFLTLSTGKKIQVPFEQLIVFSTNLDPSDLVDEAFLRRIPYKIFVRDPERKEFHALFRHYARLAGCEYHPEVIDRLITKHYLMANRSMRRCHPRDLIGQIRHYCSYKDIRMEMRDEYFDVVVRSYFADAINEQSTVVPNESDEPLTPVNSKLPLSSQESSTVAESNSSEQKSDAQPAAPTVTPPTSRENMTIMVDAKKISSAKASAPELTQIPSATMQCDPRELGQEVSLESNTATIRAKGEYEDAPSVHNTKASGPTSAKKTISNSSDETAVANRPLAAPSANTGVREVTKKREQTPANVEKPVVDSSTKRASAQPRPVRSQPSEKPKAIESESKAPVTAASSPPIDVPSNAPAVDLKNLNY